MSVTSGFFNSLKGDRRYNAKQMSAIFDGIINDGIFANIGDTFTVIANGGNSITVGIGRAWFNSTWIYNDAILPIEADISEVLLDRYDAVVIEVNHSEAVRNAAIKIVKGTPSSDPQRPVMANDKFVHQYPLAYIYRAARSTGITQSNITSMIGTSSCPYITGILQVQNIDNIVAQWSAQWDEWYANKTDEVDDWTDEKKAAFDAWFANIRGIVEGDALTALTDRVLKIEDGTTPAGDANKLGGVAADEYLKNGESAVSVKALGAVGDGVANDTEALKAAAALGKPVYFPSGTYLLYEQIDQTVDINWFGDGYSSVIKLMPADQSRPEVYGGKTVYNCYMIAQANGISKSLSLRDICLNANKEAYDSDLLKNGSSRYDHTVCFDLYAPSGVYLHNVTITNALIEGAYVYNKNTCPVLISDCRFINNGYSQEDASGLHMEGNGRKTVVSNCEFSGNGFHGLLLGGLRNANINGITCNNNGWHGVCLWGASSNNTLNGVTCKENFGGVMLKGNYSPYYVDSGEDYARNNIITGLITERNTYGIIFGNSKHTIINGWICDKDNYAYCIGYSDDFPYTVTGNVLGYRLNYITDENFVAGSSSSNFDVSFFNSADRNKYLPKTGGTLTGQLNIKNAENGYGAFSKNNSSIADYGTDIKDVNGSGNTVKVTLSANNDSVSFTNNAGASNDILHKGNSNAVKIQESSPTDTSALWVW